MKAGSIYPILSDHLNTPRKIYNESANLVWSWEVDPWGESKPDETPTIPLSSFSFNLRFAGQYFDVESDTHYNYYRTYDPSLGRYMQSDPIGLGGGMNTYGYVYQNPLKFIDPYGLDVRIVCRPANIAAGLVKHCWIVTDKSNAGMGVNPDIPPGQAYEGYGVPTQVTDHSNDVWTEESEPMNNVDEQCVDDKLAIGEPTGLFIPPFNHC